VGYVSEPLPEGVASLNGAPADSGRASVELERFEPDEIVYRVQTDRPRLLVASEVYYPAGWTATINVEPSPIVRTDFLLRGVPMPAGEHIVTLRYRPATKALGARISWVAALLVYLGAIALAGLLWYRRGTDGD